MQGSLDDTGRRTILSNVRRVTSEGKFTPGDFILSLSRIPCDFITVGRVLVTILAEPEWKREVKWVFRARRGSHTTVSAFGKKDEFKVIFGPQPI